MTSQVGVVGLGLMGGSLLRRLAVTGDGATRATGWDTDDHTRRRATAAGLAVAGSLAELAALCDVIFVAVPFTELSAVFTEISALADPATIVSDLTSVKQPVRDLAAAHDFGFVGGHPMTGTEDSGFPASDAELLAAAAWVLTLDEDTDVSDWLRVARLVTDLGCRVVPCTSVMHDSAVARISALPHVVAAALTTGAAGDPLALALAAGSFRDATRVAATRPELIAVMCGGNASAVAAELAALAERLREVQGKLDEPDQLIAWFRTAGKVRTSWPPVVDSPGELAIDAALPGQLLAVGRVGGYVTAIADGRVVVRTPRR